MYVIITMKTKFIVMMKNIKILKSLLSLTLSVFSMLWMDWLTVWCTGRILYSLVAPCPETRPHQHPVSGRVYRPIASTWSSHWSTCPEEWAPYKTRSNISFWIRSNLKFLQPHQKSVDWKFLFIKSYFINLHWSVKYCYFIIIMGNNFREFG